MYSISYLTHVDTSPFRSLTNRITNLYHTQDSTHTWYLTFTHWTEASSHYNKCVEHNSYNNKFSKTRFSWLLHSQHCLPGPVHCIVSNCQCVCVCVSTHLIYFSFAIVVDQLDITCLLTWEQCVNLNYDTVNSLWSQCVLVIMIIVIAASNHFMLYVMIIVIAVC